eukprot:3053484-Amphidinium_carterae.2
MQRATRTAQLHGQAALRGRMQLPERLLAKEGAHKRVAHLVHLSVLHKAACIDLLPYRRHRSHVQVVTCWGRGSAAVDLPPQASRSSSL